MPASKRTKRIEPQIGGHGEEENVPESVEELTPVPPDGSIEEAIAALRTGKVLKATKRAEHDIRLLVRLSDARTFVVLVRPTSNDD